MNHLLQTYMYSIGLISAIVIPTIFMIDCFYPILGVSPTRKRKAHHLKKEEGDQKEANEKQDNTLKESKKNKWKKVIN